MNINRGNVLKILLSSIFIIINLVIVLFITDMTMTVVPIATQPVNDTIPVARWGMSPTVTYVEFELKLNLPSPGLITKGMLAYITISIGSEEENYINEFILGNDYRIYIQVNLDAESQIEFRTQNHLIYTVSLILTPIYFDHQLAGSTRFLEYNGVISN